MKNRFNRPTQTAGFPVSRDRAVVETENGLQHAIGWSRFGEVDLKRPIFNDSPNVALAPVLAGRGRRIVHDDHGMDSEVRPNPATDVDAPATLVRLKQQVVDMNVGKALSVLCRTTKQRVFP